MSLFSDYKCGALSDWEFKQECIEFNKRERYDLEHLYDDVGNDEDGDDDGDDE